jgi:ABC-type branched-subunit amino acid transport system ATPase component
MISEISAQTEHKSHPYRGSDVVLRVDGLHKSFGGQIVLNNVSLTLRRGEIVLLRGPNGSGKTTLLNILTGNLEPDAGVIELRANGQPEKFVFPRRWWQWLNPWDHFTPERVASESVGRTWQDVRLFTTQNLAENIAVAAPRQAGENPIWAVLRPLLVRRQEAVNFAAAQNMVAAIGLPGRELSSADRVSLGQSKRVAIGRAIWAGAKILFLDEPLAGLDAEGISHVLGFLQDLARKGVTMVIVEHFTHVEEILGQVGTVWSLDKGRILVQRPVEVRGESCHDSSNDVRNWLCELVGSEARVIDRELGNGAILSTAISGNGDKGKPSLEVENLVVRRGNRLVIGREANGCVQGVSFTLRDGELGLLQAPNGWGKTTLLEALAGILPITSGEIRMHGRSITSSSTWERHRLGLGFLQARNHIFPNLTVREAIHLGGSRHSPESLRPFVSRKVSDLSGGERQAVAFASAFASGRSKVKLLDEPFGMLDETATRNVRYALRPEDGTATIIAVPSALNRRKELTNE